MNIFGLFLQATDVDLVLTVLKNCYEYYHSMKLSNDCINNKCRVPTACLKHNAVYNILHFLVDINFIKVNVSSMHQGCHEGECVSHRFFMLSCFFFPEFKYQFEIKHDLPADCEELKNLALLLQHGIQVSGKVASISSA